MNKHLIFKAYSILILFVLLFSLTVNLSHASSFLPFFNVKVTVTKLRNINCGDEWGECEYYFTVKLDNEIKLFASEFYHADIGETVNPGLICTFSNNRTSSYVVKVEVWEDDTWSDDDFYGLVDVSLLTESGEKTKTLLNSDVEVSVVIAVSELDSDGDGLGNYREYLLGTALNDQDTDDDTLTDTEEVNTYGTNPLKADSDGDGLNDYEEIKTEKTEPLVADTDGDGLKDGEEVKTYHTNPLKKDTDDDNLTDGKEVLEFKTDPLKADTDNDGLNDSEEVNIHKTSPIKADTDEDGLTDTEEVNLYKTDSLKADSDNDGLTDGEEIKTHHTNPLKADTDGDLWNDSVDFAPTNVLLPNVLVTIPIVMVAVAFSVVRRKRKEKIEKEIVSTLLKLEGRASKPNLISQLGIPPRLLTEALQSLVAKKVVHYNAELKVYEFPFKICAYCRNDIPAEATTCPKCGASIR